MKRKGKVLETVGSDDGRKGRSYGEGEGGDIYFLSAFCRPDTLYIGDCTEYNSKL